MTDIPALVAELRELLSKAKPLKWHSCSASDGMCPCQGISDERGTTIARFYGNDDLSIEKVTVQCPSFVEGMNYRHLASSAVNTLPTLLSRIEEQGREIERLKKIEAANNWAMSEIRSWWSFDNDQQHTHNWHSREDFIVKWKSALKGTT